MFELDLFTGRVPIRPRRAIEKLSATVKKQLGEVIPKDSILSDKDKTSLKYLQYQGRPSGTIGIYDPDGGTLQSMYTGNRLSLTVHYLSGNINPEKKPITIGATTILPYNIDQNDLNITITIFVRCKNNTDSEIIVLNNAATNMGLDAIVIPVESSKSFSITVFPVGGLILQNLE